MVESLELVVVQLDECKRLMTKPELSYQRLALLLIDNAAEVIMAHRLKNQLYRNQVSNTVLDTEARYPGSMDPIVVEDARRKFVSKKEQRDIERNFGKKVDRLVAWGEMGSPLGAGLKRLHAYRNEAYHQGRSRPETLRHAVRIYFQMVCSLLEDYGKPAPPYYKAWAPEEFAQAHPMVTKYSGTAGFVGSHDARHLTIARRLMADVDLDLRGVREDLIGYLVGRIEQIYRDINFCHTYDLGLFREDVPPPTLEVPFVERHVRYLGVVGLRRHQLTCYIERLTAPQLIPERGVGLSFGCLQPRTKQRRNPAARGFPCRARQLQRLSRPVDV